MLSIFDIFKIGVGPSSSHTVGPMRIARRFLDDARAAGALSQASRINIELRGSLGATGVGHGTDRATLLGLIGFEPETTLPVPAGDALDEIAREGAIALHEGPVCAFDAARDLALRGDVIPDFHPNEMALRALDNEGAVLFEGIYYSVGGGFIATEKQLARSSDDDMIAREPSGRFAFRSAAELLSLCAEENASIAEIVLANEDSRRPRAETEDRLDAVWRAMASCVERGLSTDGVLPGGLNVARRASKFYGKLRDNPGANERERLFDWLNCYAMAVNEENAAGGQVVTAPTNGAAGIIPSVIKHYLDEERRETEKIRTFLATAAGIGMLYKQRASISGAEMGCQGEVGVACSMAAGGLAAAWGATPGQVERAAEIGMEHNLGLTCDPVKGLVQIPCIERNAIGAVKAVNAARLALQASETPKVSLDQVIETMRQTGFDMSRKYKETSEGGLAVNVVEC